MSGHNRARRVRMDTRRRVAWVPGVDCSTQQDVLIARQHAHCVWQAIQAIVAVAGACEMLYLLHRDWKHDRCDAYRMSERAGWRVWEREESP